MCIRDRYQRRVHGERAANGVFASLNEAQITFRPTYRRQRADQTYSNKKGQAPSWCDRILYSARTAEDIEVKKYRSAEDQMASDHKPVIAEFDVRLRLPFLVAPPLHLTPKISAGRLLFKSVVVERFSFLMLADFADHFELPPGDALVRLDFHADFLLNTPSSLSASITEDERNSSRWRRRWDEATLPILQTIYLHREFLQRQTIQILLSYVVGKSALVIGYAWVPLRSAVHNNGQLTEFNAQMRLFGRIIGNIHGQLELEVDSYL
eukprot:TRINITY_DN18666_c0_g1_i3.p1 TRINITY_DN18666_c0_g1~~TRINITY_DN18666_c0_g1_i3.p1  ORF type:complete len:286 (+),score=51.34 TRINITY_DN18666_c0_g1_i3:61-858(+)